jgi:DNA helicase-2/ATP-dependent DNA helicase PcrA
MVVQERLKPIHKWIRRLQFVDVHALYRQLFANPSLFVRVVGEEAVPERWAEISRQTVEKLDRRELSYEDATPFLFLKELVQGLHINTTVRHVIVDEAQDYSDFQLEFLKRLFPRARMTVLGDLNQAIYAHGSALGHFEVLKKLYGPEQTETIRLTRSYRSTREIVEFTRGMVPGGEEIVPFNRPGEKPRVTVVKDKGELLERLAADIKAIQADGYETIAVICKTASESEEVYQALKDRIDVHLVTKFTPRFEKGALIIPAYLAKGVEFDAVMICNGSKEQYGRESERKLFYTACTRAMHRLHVYSVGEPSPFVTAQNPDTYVLEGWAKGQR